MTVAAMIERLALSGFALAWTCAIALLAVAFNDSGSPGTVSAGVVATALLLSSPFWVVAAAPTSRAPFQAWARTGVLCILSLPVVIGPFVVGILLVASLKNASAPGLGDALAVLTVLFCAGVFATVYRHHVENQT